MEIKIIQHNNRTWGELLSDSLQLRTGQDLLDIMVSAGYSGCEGLIVYAQNLDQAFFDLKTGIAGEILQKFSNYRMKISIVGDFSQYESQSLKDFIVECNRGRTVFFVDTRVSALDRLSQT